MIKRLYILFLFSSLLFSSGCGLSVPLAPLLLLAEEEDRLPVETSVSDPYARYLPSMQKEYSCFCLPDKEKGQMDSEDLS